MATGGGGSLGDLYVRIGNKTAGLKTGIKDAKTGLKELGKDTRKTINDLGKMAKTAIAAGAAFAGWKLLNTAREFDILNAQLKTATGSMQGAAIAGEAIKDFAATTPFDLQQATNGFVKLVNLGLTPSERAMTSYGNTASALGKDLNQMIEAVADAATGEFERLKEFGIKAKQQGDRVSLTFQGVTTNIGNNAAEIEKYLMDLGENQFAGAMAERVDSLDGDLSNLGDTWTNLFQTINEQGAGQLMRDGIQLATAGVRELTDMIASGQLMAQFKAMTSQFDGWVSDVQRSLLIAKDSIDAFGNSDFSIGRAFLEMPANLRAGIQIMTVEIAAFVDKTKAYGQAILDNLNLKKLLIGFAQGLPGLVSNFLELGKAVQESGDQIETKIEAIESSRQDSIDLILAERDAAITSTNDQLLAADKLREKYEEMKASRAEGMEGDRLAQFKVGGGAGGEESSGLTPEELKRIDALKDQYDTENELMMERHQMIADLNRAFEEGELESRAQFEQMRQRIITDSEEAILSAKKKYMTAQEKFSAMSMARQVSTITGQLADLTSGVAQHSRKMFELNKAAGIANAIVSAYQGISLTLATYPFPLNVAMAAAHGVAAFAQVNAIRSASFSGGGGGSAPSIAGSTPAPATSNVNSGAPGGGGGGGTFTLEGFDENKSYRGGEIRPLLDQIQEAVNMGYKLNLTPGGA